MKSEGEWGSLSWTACWEGGDCISWVTWVVYATEYQSKLTSGKWRDFVGLKGDRGKDEVQLTYMRHEGDST